MSIISIIVPVYKVEPYLHRCIDSILAQTFTDFELILVDDGSPDNCGAICDEYAKKDERILVIHQENLGQAAARNAGLDLVFEISNSEWVTFVDSDDWIHPQMLDILLVNALKYNVKISMCSFQKVTYQWPTYPDVSSFDGSLHHITEKEMQRLCYGEGSGGFVWGKLFAKELLNSQRFSKGKIYEDSAITCRWFFLAGEFFECSVPLYYYYLNNTGTMRSKFSLKQLDILWSKNEQELFYKSIAYHHMQAVVVTSYILSAAHCYHALLSELNDKTTAKQIKKLLLGKYFKNLKTVSFTKKEQQYILQMLHPKAMNFYWFITAQFKKIWSVIGKK